MNRSKTKLMGMVAAVCGVLCAGSAQAEDAYIESSGTQFINTGYHPNPNTRVELDYALLEGNDSQIRLFGNGGANPGFYCEVYVGGTVGQNACLAFASGDDSYDGTWSNMGFDTQRRTVIVDCVEHAYRIKEGGSLVFETYLSKSYSKVSTLPLGLFGRTNEADGKTGLGLAKMRVYAFRIYECGELIRDYRPALRDGLAGLYDPLSKTFLKDDHMTVYADGRSGRTAANDFASGGVLPAAEDESGYVQFDGVSQMLNSRFSMDCNSRVEFDFAIVGTITTQKRVFGAEYDASLSSCLYIDGDKDFTMVCSDEWSGRYSFIEADNDRHTAIIDAKNNLCSLVTGCTTNWSASKSVSVTHAATTPMGIGADCRNADGLTSANNTAVKVYGMKCYRNGTLVHDYVPCVKGDAAGLKDLVDGEFVTAPNLDLAYGGADILREPDDGYVELNADNAANNFIDTGIKADGTTRIEYDFSIYTSGNYLFGMGGNPGTDGLSFGGYVTSAFGINCQDGSSDNSTTGIAYAPSRRTLIIDGYNNLYALTMSGYTNFIGTITKTHTKTAPQTLILLGRRWGTGAGVDPMPRQKLYGCRIYKAGKLVRDFVPYVKNGRPGLLDNVSGDFFVGTSVANTLLAGGNIQSDGKGSAYLESDGTQAIDTGYVPNAKTKVVCDYQLVASESEARVFGAMSDKMCAQLRVSGANMNVYYNGYYSDLANANIGACDLYRHEVTLDLKNGSCLLDGANVLTLNARSEGTDASKNATLSLFAKNRWYGSPSFVQFSKVRIYSFEIWEDDALLHRYLPCCDGDVVGFKDVAVPGSAILVNKVSSATPLKIGGCGCGSDNAAFFAAPSDCTVEIGGSVTLSAYAPGAIAYQWFVNGKELEGETGMTCTVDWRKSRTDDTYAVRATFNEYDHTVERTVTAKVSYQKLGMSIIVR